MNLMNVFNKTIYDIGLNGLEQPIFYHAPVGIRFEIGGEEDVYVTKGMMRKLQPNPKYVNEACERALTIFNSLPQSNWVLRVDVYDKRDTDMVNKKLRLGTPKETVKKKYFYEEDEITHYELYWDLNEIDWSVERIIKEIVLADIGGWNSLASAVFLLHTKEHILYHLYDDRGLDVVAKNKEALRSLYEKYGDWILEYDREQIDFLFNKSGDKFELNELLTFLNQLEKSNIYENVS